MSVCVGCTKEIRGNGCSKKCMDYLLQSLTQDKPPRKYTKQYSSTLTSRSKMNHVYLGGK